MGFLPPQYMKSYFYTFLSFFLQSLIANTVTIRFSSVFLDKDLSQSQMSTVLMGFGIASMVSSSFLGVIISKFGDKKVFLISGLLSIAIAPFMQFMSYLMLIVYAVLMSVVLTAMNIAMNNQTAVVEKKSNIKIMSKCHGTWSLSSIATSLIAFGFAKFEVPAFYHILAIDVPVLLLLIYTFRQFVSPDASDETIKKPNQDVQNQDTQVKSFIPIAILLVSFTGMMFTMLEGCMSSWTILGVTKEKNILYQDAILILGAFQTGMTVMRLFGDIVRKHFSIFKFIIFAGVMSSIGLSIFLFTKNLYTLMLGDFLIGLALAPLSPFLMVVVANYDIKDSAKNIGIFLSMVYSSVFLAPALIGYVSTVSSIMQSLYILYGSVVLGTLSFSIYTIKYEKKDNENEDKVES